MNQEEHQYFVGTNKPFILIGGIILADLCLNSEAEFDETTWVLKFTIVRMSFLFTSLFLHSLVILGTYPMKIGLLHEILPFCFWPALTHLLYFAATCGICYGRWHLQGGRRGDNLDFWATEGGSTWFIMVHVIHKIMAVQFYWSSIKFCRRMADPVFYQPRHWVEEYKQSHGAFAMDEWLHANWVDEEEDALMLKLRLEQQAASHAPPPASAATDPNLESSSSEESESDDRRRAKFNRTRMDRSERGSGRGERHGSVLQRQRSAAQHLFSGIDEEATKMTDHEGKEEEEGKEPRLVP